MKISTRISIIFSLVASVVLVVFGVAIYLLESYHQKRDFQERLKERVLITENFFLEKESFSQEEYEKIRAQFLHVLTEETEEVIELNGKDAPEFSHVYSLDLQKSLIGNENFTFSIDELQGESKIFQVNGADYLIIVTAIDKVGVQNLSFLLSSIILLIVLVVPFVFIISFFVAKKSLLPISKKIKHANSISASNLHQRLEIINPNDEIGELAIAFNRLLDRLEIAFNAQKAFISNASHEIKNPLTAIMGEAEIAVSKTRTPSEYQESLNSILEAADTLNFTVNNLLQLSKVSVNEESVQYSKFNFEEFLQETKISYDYLNPENKIKLKTDTGAFIIEGNQNLLKTAILNIFDNACKYSTNQAVIVELKKEEENLVLIVSDIGIGIPKEAIKKITEPFYRANNTFQIKGSGIGLSLSAKIIDLHKGTLKVTSKEGEGTIVTINLPLSV